MNYLYDVVYNHSIIFEFFVLDWEHKTQIGDKEPSNLGNIIRIANSALFVGVTSIIHYPEAPNENRIKTSFLKGNPIKFDVDTKEFYPPLDEGVLKNTLIAIFDAMISLKYRSFEFVGGNSIRVTYKDKQDAIILQKK